MLLQRVTLVTATLVLLAPTESTPPPHTDAQNAAPGSRTVPPLLSPDTQDVDPSAGRSNTTEPDLTPPAPRVTLPEPLSTVERDALQWALARFESAGLELPTVSVSFSADTDNCNGEQGVYRRRSGNHSVVVCVPEREGAAIDHRRKRTLLHELAHAWDHATLTDAQRNDLQQHFGADDWYAPDQPWETRPVEQLAETLTWGLLDQPRRPLLIDRPCKDVHADFKTLTGQRPLGPIEPNCEINESRTRPESIAPDQPTR